jgi:hypothetical protein
MSFWQKISGENLLAKEVKLHHTCRRAYVNKAAKCAKPQKQQDPNMHEKAIDSIKLHVQQTLIDNEGAEKLTSLFARYIGIIGTDDTSYTSQKLCERLLNAFPVVLSTCKHTNKEGVIVHHHSLGTDNAIKRANFDDNSLKEAAFYLRNLILVSKTHTLEDSWDIKTNIDSKPKEITEFFRILYSGKSSADPPNESSERLVQFVSDDVVYAISRGRTKPEKHISLALGLKSMTGSRRVLEILNRFGHCVSYHTVETTETQMATDISNRNQATPHVMITKPQLCSSLAWDNYDECTETLSGRGTLHDTVGISYQNIRPDDENEQEHDTKPEENLLKHSGTKSSKRSFQMNELVLEPYRKKAKMTNFNYEVKQMGEPPHRTLVQHRDLFWMMNLSVSPGVPMWDGCN